jgi:hypothetical protein
MALHGCHSGQERIDLLLISFDGAQYATTGIRGPGAPPEEQPLIGRRSEVRPPPTAEAYGTATRVAPPERSPENQYQPSWVRISGTA